MSRPRAASAHPTARSSCATSFLARSRRSSSTSRCASAPRSPPRRACPSPEWGAMLDAARSDMLLAPHEAIFPALAIFLTVLAFNLLGDGLRDALDPKIEQR